MDLPHTLRGVTLAQGPHDPGGPCLCLMEAVARYAGEAHTTTPACASPTLTPFAHLANDWFPDHERNRLLALVPQIAATGPETEPEHGDRESKRRYVMADFCARRFVPLALDRHGLVAHALPFTQLPVIRNVSSGYRFAALLAETADRLPSGPAGRMLRWMARGLEPFLDGTEASAERGVLYLFEPINLSHSDPKTRRLAIRAIDECLQALLVPAVTKRGWVFTLAAA